MSMNFAPWEGADVCTGSVTNGARALLAWLVENFDEGRSLGIYNCRTVRGGSTTSLHGEGRAVDWFMPHPSGDGSAAGHALVKRLGEHGKRLGIQCIIYDREIWSARSPDGRYYGGSHPHYDHLHIELTWAAARALNLTTLRTVLGTETGMAALKNGDEGKAVKRYQTALLEWNSSALPVYGADSDFGDETETWVKKFQSAHNLQSTGVIDGVTAEMLGSVLGGGEGEKGPRGDKGPTGDKGPDGDKGPQGDPGPDGEPPAPGTPVKVVVDGQIA